MKPPLEKHIQKACLDYLKMKGYLAWRNQTTGTYNAKSGGFIPSQAVGAPDILMLHKGVFYGIEIKTDKGVLSDAQRAFGAPMEASIWWHAVSTT